MGETCSGSQLHYRQRQKQLLPEKRRAQTVRRFMETSLTFLLYGRPVSGARLQQEEVRVGVRT